MHGENPKLTVFVLTMNSCESLKSPIQLDIVFVALLPQFLV